MDNGDREALAALCLEAGALAAEPGAETSLRWADSAALEDARLREKLLHRLAELVREHYAASEALLGDAWAALTAEALGLPMAGEALPERPLLILGSSGDIGPWLPALCALRASGGSPAVAVLWNGREEELRLRLDRADIRCHWLLDLESGAAVALQMGLLDFDDYCRLLP